MLFSTFILFNNSISASMYQMDLLHNIIKYFTYDNALQY